jgi:hypothetical protein
VSRVSACVEESASACRPRGGTRNAIFSWKNGQKMPVFWFCCTHLWSAPSMPRAHHAEAWLGYSDAVSVLTPLAVPACALSHTAPCVATHARLHSRVQTPPRAEPLIPHSYACTALTRTQLEASPPLSPFSRSRMGVAPKECHFSPVLRSNCPACSSIGRHT